MRAAAIADHPVAPLREAMALQESNTTTADRGDCRHFALTRASKVPEAHREHGQQQIMNILVHLHVVLPDNEEMPYESGSTLVLRDFYPDGRIRAVECGRVVADDELGTVVWVGNGSAVIRRATLAGEPTGHLPYPAKMHTPTLLTAAAWHGSGVLILTPRNAAHCVWWFFNDDGVFDGWYINLQTPARRWWGGIDLEDQALDVVVAPDRRWRWKDEEDFLARTGSPMFWNATEAAAIQAEAHRVIGLAETGAAPFDGRWCDFRPEPTWRPTDLPWWWDLPMAEGPRGSGTHCQPRASQRP